MKQNIANFIYLFIYFRYQRPFPGGGHGLFLLARGPAHGVERAAVWRLRRGGGGRGGPAGVELFAEGELF